MRAHVIENGIVVNTIEVSSLNFMPNLVEATAGGIGWLYEDGSFIDPNTPTQDVIDEQSKIAIRLRRNNLLAESDWIVIMHTENGTSIPMEWALYRQALRDITTQAGFPHNINWPIKPE